MKHTTKIENKIILVTGANRGIGKAITESLLDQGASRVYAAVRRIETLAPLQEKYGDRLIPLTLEAYQYEQDINVYGLIRMARAFAPVLKANGGGALVQLNSVASIKSFEALATYSASKAASYSITQALRALLKEQGTQRLGN